MIRLGIDENFDHHILRALMRRVPNLDARTVMDAGLAGADDPTVLEWAAREGPLPGVIEVLARAAIGEVVEDLILVVQCSMPEDLRDRVLYVPLR